MSAEDGVRELTQCSPDLGCGKTDDHLKVHYGPVTLHSDCLPPQIEQDATRFADQLPMQQALVAQINTARNGIHGDDLREMVEQFHQDVTVPALEHIEATDERPDAFLFGGPAITLDMRPDNNDDNPTTTTKG